MTTLTASLARLTGAKSKGAALVSDAPPVNDRNNQQIYSGGAVVPFVDGRLAVQLPATDTPGTDPTAWQYGLTVTWDGGSLPTIRTDLTGETVDLSSLQSMGPTNPAYLPPADVAAARLETFQARDVAIQAHDAAATSEANAGGHAFVAGQAYAGAVEQRQLAQAARDAALSQNFGGVALGTADLDAITTPGIYRQATQAEATAARHYPTDAQHIWTIDVRQASQNAGSAVMQYATPVGGSNATRGKFIYIRRLVNGAWDPWSTLARQRVDKTAGIAIYTWDDVGNREQLVYGDTGWRDVTTLLLNGWSTTTRVMLRRLTYKVMVSIDALNPAAATDTAFLELPSGFALEPAAGRFLLHTAATPTVAYRTLLSSNRIQVPGVTSSVSLLYGTFETSTSQAWPGALPGTPYGAITNL